MEDKQTLRRALLNRRNAIPPEVRRVKDRLIQENLTALEEYRRARVIFIFASFRSEVDTFGIMDHARAEGKSIVLPRVDRDSRTLVLFSVPVSSRLRPGFMGIPEPDADAEQRTEITEVDLVVIPGACYDEAGNRLGYGGGYYDRLLSGLRESVPVIAPAYEEQIVGEVPAEPHDIRVHAIVTDRRTIRCS